MQAYKDVTVSLSTLDDGNAYAIIGAVRRALRDAVGGDVEMEWMAYAESSESYDQLLQRAMEVVNVV